MSDRDSGLTPPRFNWLALLSFVLSSALACLAGFTYWLSKRPSSPSGGIAGLGELLELMLVFYVLLHCTYFGAPLAIVLGIGAILGSSGRAKNGFGRAMALLGILMSALVLGTVIVAHVRVANAFHDAGKDWPASPEEQTVKEREEAGKLAWACHLYTDFHEGQYPPDADSLRDYLVTRGDPLAKVLQNYVYVGHGLKDEYYSTVDSTRQERGGKLIVLVSRTPVKGEFFIVTFKGGSGAPFVKAIRINDLPHYFDLCNEARGQIGLEPVHFGGTPTTQP